MEVFGLHEYIKDVTRRLGKLGALAVAPDYYFRQGNLASISEIKDLMPLVNAKSDTELISDLDATVRWAEAQGGDRNRIRHHRLLPRWENRLGILCREQRRESRSFVLRIAHRSGGAKIDLAEKPD